jgi:outer membrane protein OmpA-like peptidoglycan-associated protein
MVTAEEMSAIVGATLAADGEDGTGTTTCRYQAAKGTTPHVELTVDWGGGSAAMTASSILSRREPGISNPLDGLGDDASAIGPVLWIRLGEDLVNLTLWGVEDDIAAAKRIIGVMRPRMGPRSQPKAADTRGGGGDTAVAIPKEAQELLGGLLGALGQGQAGAQSTAGGTSAATNGSHADAPMFRSAVGLPRRPIPLVKGLTMVTAVHERNRGDYEPMLVVREVTPEAISVRFSASLPEGHDITVPRVVRREDFNHARKSRTWFQEGDPEVLTGTTAFGVSIAVFNELTANREAAFELYRGRGNAVLDALSPLLGSQQDSDTAWQRGTLKRVEPHPLAIPLLVNNEPVELPAIHAQGTLGGERFDYYILDDPDLPLVLRAAGRNVLHTVRIAFPVDSEQSALEEQLRTTGRVAVYGIYFDFAKSTLRPDSERALDEIAGALKNNPDWTLNIEGHTDNIGGDGYNLDLSRRRAAAVRNQLIERHRIAPDRLTTDGYGAARPKASNDTLSGRARNRRVELVRQLSLGTGSARRSE